MQYSSLIIFIFGAILQLVKSQRCFHNVTLSHSESDIQKEVQNLIDNKLNVEFSCLQVLIERGYYKAALDLYEGYFMVQKVDIRDEVRNLTTTTKKQFSKWTQTMEIANAQVQQIKPVLEWAQSRSNVFIYMKKALRKDAPGCIDCTKDEKVEFKKDGIYASSFGIITNSPINWILDLQLEGEINPEQSFWKESGVGIIFFNLTKAENGTLWRDLEKNSTKQTQIWWDMREKHKKDMDDWMKMVQGEEASTETESEEEKEDGENGKNDGENSLKKEKEKEKKQKEEKKQEKKEQENKKKKTKKPKVKTVGYKNKKEQKSEDKKEEAQDKSQEKDSSKEEKKTDL